MKSDAEHKSLSQFALMWRKFKHNKLAVTGGIIVLIIYILIMICEFFSPYGLNERNYSYIKAPPQRIRIVDEEGLSMPYVYNWKMEMNPETLRRNYKVDKSKKYYLKLFTRSDESYKLFGLFEANIHLYGVEEGGTVFLLGTDRFGRDMLTRVLYGGRISLSIGLFGVSLSIVLGSVLGTISGFFGGYIDILIQRVVEVLKSFPRLPLWLTLAAALPQNWSSIKVYFAIVSILAIIGWTGLCRAIRAKVLSYREQEYVKAARAAGASHWWIIKKHLIPNSLSHIIVVATMSIPGMILGEASLSFLGLGIKAPMTSWGVLLQEAQNVRTIAYHPWLFIPGIFIIITILSFNFFGDGLRDAADPYSQ